MKKILSITLTLLLFLNVLSGCISKYAYKDFDGSYRMYLPKSKQSIKVKPDYSLFFEQQLISDELLKKAEESIRKQLDEANKHSDYFLSTDNEGYLCLTVEIIVEYTGYTDPAGCGYDHDHTIIRERISSRSRHDRE